MNFIGEIKLIGESFAPSGWALCNGQLLAIQSNSALYSILGTTYGGNGTTTFALPNLQGTVPVGAGNGPGLTPLPLGEQYGTETVTLNVTNLPSHTHNVKAVSANGTVSTPTGNYFADKGRFDNDYTTNLPNVQMNPLTVGVAGNSLPVPIMQPYMALYYVIALQGVFPARN
ncbi:phage tail protein [Pedobacter roseus]|jgi:microcystin-dependent protein|uniref:Phage tail protein n=1 Tax=Pedobacter roseus TaxID=336820 RepID=A0A7G9QKA0_9SPHI|nr:tail fiber protein [Pedobacter roseus]QNN43775.1 phage tail protein [Pedobacter roseus]